MPTSVHRLLAGPAMAGLLFLLPMGHANAQDNRDNWSWAEARVVVVSFLAGGAVGGTASWLLLQRARKGKRDDGTMDAILTRFDQLNDGIEALNGKLTQLKVKSAEGIHGLSRTLESKINPDSVQSMPASLKAIEQHIVKVEEIVERAIQGKEGEQIEQSAPNFDTTDSYARPIIIDTCAIIDGRIIDLLKFDFFEELKGRIILADCVLKEIESMGKYKPECHSRGYKNLYRLSRRMSHRIEEKITPSDRSKSVDEKLLQLTIDTNGILITMDGGLISLCRSRNVRVLNLNDLQTAVRKPRPLIGSRVKVNLNQQEEEKYLKERPNSAIASIDDQLIVIEDGKPYIGRKKAVIITGWSDSATGPVFAKLISSAGESPAAEAAESTKTSPTP